MVTVPHHGGRLQDAARRWDIPPEQWLDLSTGINPLGWPVPPVPESVWQRLPEPDDGLDGILRRWAQVPDGAACLPVPGSQAAIMALPALRQPGIVGVPDPGYEEHGHWWQRLRHQVKRIPIATMSANDDRWLDGLDVLVCINPNNPTGLGISAEKLMRWHRRLSQRNGWLVVDEAFIEASDCQSLVPFTGRPGLVVMRSLGKFFGLAGLRAGAVMTSPDIGERLSHALGPWPVNGPARYLMALALADHEWQRNARQMLARNSNRLHQILRQNGIAESSGTGLFRYVRLNGAQSIADALAARGILVRVFSQPLALRIGLPGAESEWLRLEQALSQLAKATDR